LLKKMLGYGVKFYVSIMASVVIFRADLLIVNHFRGAGEAGVGSRWPAHDDPADGGSVERGGESR